MLSLQQYLEPITTIVHAAGRAAMEVFNDDGLWNVQAKDDDSPLTEADVRSHQVIEAGIRQLTPDIPILSEEGHHPSWDVRQTWTAFWLIDPLDGTKEFIRRSPEFTINVALIVNGQPVLGFVHAPALAGAPIWRGLVSADGVAQKALAAQNQIEWKQISVRYHQQASWKILISQHHPSPQEPDFVARFEPHECIKVGSSLKMCLIAEGEADVYPRFGPTMQWDTAAAHAVLAAAGGTWQWLHANTNGYHREALVNPGFIVSAKPLSCSEDYIVR